jgi:predicted MPP superfamily phosphohydrolase
MTVDAREVTRRLFLSRSIALGAGVAAAGVGGYGLSRAMADPVVRRVPVQIYGLDPRLAGFRIAMFSDAHLGAIRRKPAMEKLVDTVNGTEPDMVAVLGDLIDGSVADLGGDVAPMAGLLSPQGSFFVTGNHEYYSGVQEWVDYLPDLGVRVLSNERLTIERDGAALDLAGVTDITGEGYDDSPDYEAALAGRRADRPVVLLCHQPVNVDKAVEYGVDLQLSGHTHGGQLWPFHYLIAAQQGAVSGLSRIEDTQLYVTAGAGFWGPPMRVGADPEVVVIELHPQDRII